MQVVNSLQWTGGTHVLLIGPLTSCLGYSYYRIRYAYVTYTRLRLYAYGDKRYIDDRH